MHVSVYTRHSAQCKYKSDPSYKRCGCPKWHSCAEWNPNRRSAKTRSWAEAEDRARELEKPDAPTEVSLSEAIKSYTKNIESRNLSRNYLLKLTRELNAMELWATGQRVFLVSKITLLHLEEYRTTWKGAPGTRARQQERLRGFFAYCRRHGWTADNYAKYLSPIKVRQTPTMPFTAEEWAKILKAATEPRVRVFLELLRWSGLRMGDAAKLERGRIDGKGRLLLYMQKTGHPVYVPLPPRLVADLDAIHFPAVRWDYDNWHKKLKAVFEAAGVPDGHGHRIRDTFACELLVAGVPLDQVSVLLGHASIRTTQQSYAPWIKGRQDQLEASVARTWSKE